MTSSSNPDRQFNPDLGRAQGALTGGQWMTLVAAFLGWMFDGFEMGIFPIVARPALQQMGFTQEGDISRWMANVTALFLLGAAGGGLVFGWLGARIGRARAMSLR